MCAIELHSAKHKMCLYFLGLCLRNGYKNEGFWCFRDFYVRYVSNFKNYNTSKSGINTCTEIKKTGSYILYECTSCRPEAIMSHSFMYSNVWSTRPSCPLHQDWRSTAWKTNSVNKQLYNSHKYKYEIKSKWKPCVNTYSDKS